MFLAQTIRMCIKNILSNKLRSFLTMLGIIIGISSVVVLVGFTQGATESINSSLQNLAANVVSVSVYNDDTDSLTYTEVEDLSFNFATDTLYTNSTRTFVRKDSTSGMYTLVGVTSNFLDVHDFSLFDGRNLAVLDVDNNSKVVLLGYTVATNIFETASAAINEKVLVGSEYYTVIGVLAEGSSSDSDYDSSIIIPITTYADSTDDDTIATIYFVGNESNPNTGMMSNMIKRTLGSFISTDNLEIVTKDTVSDTVSEIDEVTTLLISLIGIISLVVSGIGVMNIMIVSVSERTREIGVRKAIGASDIDILKQFLIEAVLLTTSGGFIGVFIGFIFNIIAKYMNLSFSMNLNIVGISLTFSILIGILFGIIPAIRASKLKPIEALKYD